MSQKLVLIVEDNIDNCEIYSAILGYHDFATVSAHNGLEGVERAREHQPDLILMDIRMPVMDGWEATRRIKSEDETSRIPVVAITADSGIDRREAEAVGFASLLNKPVAPSRLIAEIQAFIS